MKGIKNGHFSTWPILTVELISAHLPKSEATVFGHMDQTRKNIRSTKIEKLSLEMERYFSPREENNNSVFAYIGLANPDTGKIYIDLTGSLPVTSNRGM